MIEHYLYEITGGYFIFSIVMGTIEGLYCGKQIPASKLRSIPAMIIINFISLYACYKFVDIITDYNLLGDDLFFAVQFFEPFVFFAGYLAITIACKALTCGILGGFKDNIKQNVALHWKFILLNIFCFWFIREFAILKVYLR